MEQNGGSSPAVEKATGDALVVVLVGPPGSGKSTFCDAVMRGAARPWARICQDIIGNGKPGTKAQCVKAAEEALRDGKSVFIDRCNMDQEQRAEFVNLTRANVILHAVVLDLPAKVCISRSVQRTGHEGNLQGGKAAAVVNRMLQNKQAPTLSEGFARITFCQDDNEIKNAVSIYSKLGPSDVMPPGMFGQKAKREVQVGIMKFLKKVDGPHSGKSDDRISLSGERKLFFDSSVPRVEHLEAGSSKDINGEEKGNRETSTSNSSSYMHYIDIATLAFPSISTSDFQFDLERASEIIVDVVDDFLKKDKGLKLVLVDISPKSRILSLVRDKAAERNIDSNNFRTFVGDITQLRSKGGLQCTVIANAANWRLKPGGGGVNAAIYNAAGELLEHATKKRADTLSPGNSLVVPLPSTSPLYQREGVTHVIHVLGPNMNPHRPNCLKEDYDKGSQILRQAYMSLFENFAAIFQSHMGDQAGDSGYVSACYDIAIKGSSSSPRNGKKNELENCNLSEREKKYRCLMNDAASNDGSHGQKRVCPTMSSNVSSAKQKEASGNVVRQEAKREWNSWALALFNIAMHPENHKETILEFSDDYVILNDLYPKAKRHILVLSRMPGLDFLADVHREHIPLLKKMHSAGIKWIQKFLSEDASMSFRLGYHSVPSMRQLHLHVISQDFDTPFLKNKKHWNSFTTSFFRDSVDVLAELEQHGTTTVMGDDKLLVMELRCHKCRSAHPNIPKLKSHIANCRASFPQHLHQNGRLLSASSASASQT